MGLIKAVVGAAASTLEDQWLEYIYCDRMPDNVLMRKGTPKNNSNNKCSKFLSISSNGIILRYTRCS